MIGLKLCIRQSSGLLAGVVEVGQFHAGLELGRDFPGSTDKAGIDMEAAVGPETITTAMIPKTVIIDFIRLTADRVVSVEQVETPQCLLGFILEGFGRFGSIFQDKIDQSAELWAILQTCGTAHYLYALNGVELWRVICFRISERITADVISILADVEFPASVWTQTPGGDTDLNATGVTFPDLNTGHFGHHLPHRVVHDVALYIIHHDERVFLSRVDGGAYNFREKVHVRSGVFSNKRDLRHITDMAKRSIGDGWLLRDGMRNHGV